MRSHFIKETDDSHNVQKKLQLSSKEVKYE